jgi:apolipoprotein N-acyltransferase
MARTPKWLPRGGHFNDATDIIPAVGDDDTGATAVHADDDPGTDIASDDTSDAPRETAVDDDASAPPEALDHDRRVAPRQRLADLGAAILRWLRTVLLPRLLKALVPRLPRLATTIAAGLLLCASFPSVNWWWAAIVAFALLAWVLTRPATTLLGGLGYGYLFGLLFYLSLMPWIAKLVGAMPLTALVIVCALFPALFGLLAVVVRRLPGWPIWFALLWAAQEWAKCTVPFGGFPWGVVAAGQTDGPFLPLVRLGGVSVLSTAIVLVGCSLTAITLEILAWWRHSRGGSRATNTAGTATAEAPPAVVLPAVCICLVLLASIVVWPPVRRSGSGAGNDATVTVAAVQGNVPRLGLEFNAQRLAVLHNHVRETIRLAEDVHTGRAPQPQFVVWPEDASEIDPLLNADASQQITAAVAAIGAPILVGALTDMPGATGAKPAARNTVIVWNPRTGPGDRHDKQIVQPFGEYLPWRGFFRHITSLADWASNIVPGESTGVVHAAGVPVGVATCWEVIFDRALRESVHNGAQVLVVPANNANFNQRMSEQQLAFAKVRAVELDRYVVVASNTGISAVVAPDGRELARTDFFVPAYLDNQVRLKTTTTPAASWGPIVQWILVIAGAAAVLAAVRHNGWFPRPKRSRPRPTDDSVAPADGVEDAPLDDGKDAASDADDDETPAEGGRHSARPGPDKGAT